MSKPIVIFQKALELAKSERACRRAREKQRDYVAPRKSATFDHNEAREFWVAQGNDKVRFVFGVDWGFDDVTFGCLVDLLKVELNIS